MTARERAQIVRAIRAYEASPNKGDYPPDTLRNMMDAAQAAGINWQPKFSVGRAVYRLADSALLGLLPGNTAVTRGEQVAGNLGSLLGMLGTGGALAAGRGVKMAASAAGAKGLSSRVAKYAGKGLTKADEAVAASRSAASEATALVGKGASKAERNQAAKFIRQRRKAEELSQRAVKAAESAEDYLVKSPALQRALAGSFGYGTAGAVYGGAQGFSEGDVLGGAVGGAISGGLLGGLGGAAASPALVDLMKNHKLATGAIGAPLAGSLLAY